VRYKRSLNASTSFVHYQGGGGERDPQVHVDEVTGSVVDRLGLQVVLGHPERFSMRHSW
jgi:hypothetical protein